MKALRSTRKEAASSGGRNPHAGEIEYVDEYLSDVEVYEPDLLGPTFEVESILDRRFNANLECYQFLVKWKDYPDSANSWEIEDNISSFMRDIELLDSNHKDHKKFANV